MRIAPAFLECVFFVCVDAVTDDGQNYHRPIGTGFKVGVPASPGKSFIYLVTARHVIEEPQKSTLWVRFNTKEGLSVDLSTSVNDWTLARDADVATMRMDVPTLLRLGIEDRRVPTESFIESDDRYRGDLLGGTLVDDNAVSAIDNGIPVQPGSDIFTVGLFSQHYGQIKNVPLARFGRVAAIPDEPINMRRFGGAETFSAKAYLVETQSWGGISGSPVFWTIPMLDAVDIGDGIRVQTTTDKIVLLGLVSGHFPIEQAAKTRGDVIVESEGAIAVDMNAGIAAVTPAWSISDLLMTPQLRTERDALLTPPARE